MKKLINIDSLRFYDNKIKNWVLEKVSKKITESQDDVLINKYSNDIKIDSFNSYALNTNVLPQIPSGTNLGPDPVATIASIDNEKGLVINCNGNGGFQRSQYVLKDQSGEDMSFELDADDYFVVQFRARKLDSWNGRSSKGSTFKFWVCLTNKSGADFDNNERNASIFYDGNNLSNLVFDENNNYEDYTLIFKIKQQVSGHLRFGFGVYPELNNNVLIHIKDFCAFKATSNILEEVFDPSNQDISGTEKTLAKLEYLRTGKNFFLKTKEYPANDISLLNWFKDKQIIYKNEFDGESLKSTNDLAYTLTDQSRRVVVGNSKIKNAICYKRLPNSQYDTETYELGLDLRSVQFNFKKKTFGIEKVAEIGWNYLNTSPKSKQFYKRLSNGKIIKDIVDDGSTEEYVVGHSKNREFFRWKKLTDIITTDQYNPDTWQGDSGLSVGKTSTGKLYATPPYIPPERWVYTTEGDPLYPTDVLTWSTVKNGDLIFKLHSVTSLDEALEISRQGRPIILNCSYLQAPIYYGDGSHLTGVEKNIVKTTMDAVAIAGVKYFLGEQSAVSVTLPSSAEVGQEIAVVWYNGATPATFSISGSVLGDAYTPSANSRSEINLLWDGTNWSMVALEQALPEVS